MQAIAPRRLDLNETIAGMSNMLGRLIGEDIELLWRPASTPWSVNMDPTQIDQIMVNLVVNARDAITGVGKITIETGAAVLDEAYCAQHPGFLAGDYVLLAPDVMMTAANYRIHDGAPIEDQAMDEADILVGRDVWVGRGVTVLAGAVIGEGAVIAANSLVRGEIPPYAIAAGSPARVVGQRRRPDAAPAP